MNILIFMMTRIKTPPRFNIIYYKVNVKSASELSGEVGRLKPISRYGNRFNFVKTYGSI